VYATRATSTASPKTEAPRREMTVEEALRWAVRDELPKLIREQESGGLGSRTHPMWAGGLFPRVDNWNREPGLPAALGTCHPDAVRINDALLAIDPADLDLSGYLISYKLAEGFSPLAVMEAARERALVIVLTCARQGIRPDLGGGPEFEPATTENGKITIWQKVQTPAGEGPDGRPWFTTTEARVQTRGDKRGGTAYPTGSYCKLHWTRDGADVAESRARYAVWHAMLLLLEERLSLASIKLKPMTAPARPWLDEVDPEQERRVIASEKPWQDVAELHDEAPTDGETPKVAAPRAVDLSSRRPAGRRRTGRLHSEVRRIPVEQWQGEERA
jgi:hypothetical protein